MKYRVKGQRNIKHLKIAWSHYFQPHIHVQSRSKNSVNNPHRPHPDHIPNLKSDKNSTKAIAEPR